MSLPAGWSRRCGARRGALVALLAAVAVSGCNLQQGLDSQSPKPGTSIASPIVGKTIDGKTFDSAQFKGHPMVVDFWASWCGPCVEEMPEMSQLQRDYAKKGIQFVGLGVDSDKNVQAFLQKVKVAYPIYVTGFGGADLARAFGNTAGGLPYTVVIDAKGDVRSTKLGQIDPQALKQTLDSL